MAFGLFKKRKNKEQEGKKVGDSVNCILKDVINETDEAVSLVLDLPEMEYKAGQFITLIDEVNGKKIRRAYSLCTAHGVDEFPAVTIKRVEGGQMSNHVNDTYKADDEIEILLPMGNFTIEKAEESSQVVLIGGGSGITPLMGLTKEALHKTNKRVLLIYANRDEQSIIFENGLKDLAREFNGRFELIHSLDTPSESWSGLKGFLTQDTIDSILKEKGVNLSQSTCYTCGPEPLMNLAFNSLIELGAASDRVFKESFTSAEDKSKVKIQTDSLSHPVRVIMDGEEFLFDVPAKKSILETGLDQDVDMPYSCQSGLCTACRGKLISGKVDMTESDGLSQEELDSGYILCCVGHPKTDDVVIEIG